MEFFITKEDGIKAKYSVVNGDKLPGAGTEIPDTTISIIVKIGQTLYLWKYVIVKNKEEPGDSNLVAGDGPYTKTYLKKRWQLKPTVNEWDGGTVNVEIGDVH